jgi:glucose/arabinose dehydrogenase
MKPLFLVLAAWCCVWPAAAQVELFDAFPGLPAFDDPVGLEAPGDGSGRLYVVERRGLLLSFGADPAVSRADTVLDLRARVRAGYIEEGFLGLAFHPDFAENGHFYVYYFAPGAAERPVRSVIARYTLSAEDLGRADPASEQVVLEVPQPDGSHNGGQLAFGPDGYLYIALGDGGCCGDPMGRAQDRTSLYGTVLRIDVDNPSGERPYGIPPDNPFAGNEEGYREEIYAYGLRNPWRFSFDAETGGLWLGDVGEGTWEEVNRVEAGGNYGWNVLEGDVCFGTEEACDRNGLLPPVWAYAHNPGRSITGGYVYRGTLLPALSGKYLFGDFSSGQIWSLAYVDTSDVAGGDWDVVADEGEVAVAEELLDTEFGISAFGRDARGEVYAVSFHDGRLYQLRPGEPLPTEQPAPGAGLRLALAGPNPFYGRTMLEFEVERPGPVRLAVYDLLGREVAVLVDQEVPGGAVRRVAFEARGLPAGVYVCRLRSEGGVRSQPVVLVR